MEAHIAEHAAAPIPPTSPTYDQAPLGHRAAMIYIRDDIPEEDIHLRGMTGFDSVVLVMMPELKLEPLMIAEDVVIYQAQVHKQESEHFYTQFHDAQTDRRDIRLEIDVVRGQRTAYKTELHEVRQVYLNSEAQNRALLARLETLETHMSRMEWQRQRAEDDAGKDVSAYTQPSRTSDDVHQFLLDETAKIDKYIGGLPDNIHENVMSARPKTFDFAIELANDLMDKKLRTYAERQNDNKRKADDSSEIINNLTRKQNEAEWQTLLALRIEG
ncbi:hypothetical protein Tco_0465173 [Tanacetum coccineum]